MGKICVRISSLMMELLTALSASSLAVLFCDVTVLL